MAEGTATAAISLVQRHKDCSAGLCPISNQTIAASAKQLAIINDTKLFAHNRATQKRSHFQYENVSVLYRPSGMRQGALEIQSYARYYARKGDTVYAAYVVHEDGRREREAVCEFRGSRARVSFLQISIISQLSLQTVTANSAPETLPKNPQSSLEKSLPRDR